MTHITESNNKSFLTKKDIPYVTVCLTENILKHSIFDANANMRRFLEQTGIHDYNKQKFGNESKVKIATHILTFTRDISSETSLYRSATRGDTRMWFGSPVLSLSQPNDVYAVTVKNGELYILNISRINIETCFSSSIPNPIQSWIQNHENNE